MCLRLSQSHSRPTFTGTAERAFKRIGDQKIVMDISKLDVSDENSIFKYEVDLSVGGRDFVMRFRNNKASHKIDCLWVGTADDGKKVCQQAAKRNLH